jgi:hypothetical protein
MRKTKELILIFGFLIAVNAYGLQTLNLKANGSSSAKISASELSRIFVDGDRIQSVSRVAIPDCSRTAL